MRPFYTIALLGILILGVPLFQAHATGNVLVPSTDNSSTPPDLGLLPQEMTPAPSPVTSSPPVFDNSSNQSTLSSPAYTPPAPQMPPPNPQSTPDMKAYIAAAMQTRVMKMPDYASLFQPPIGNLPNSVGINIDTSWTPSFVQRVNDQLGIPSAQVPASCRPSTKGFVVTDKGNAPFDAGATSHVVAKYDGKITMVVVTSIALCSMSFPLPPNKGVIMQMGDSYMVALGSGSCQVPPGNSIPSTISFSAGPYGILQCKF